MPRRANRTRTGGATTRFQLSLAPTTLASLKKAIETACNVPAARAARMTRGRAAAAALLKGIRTRVVDAKAESVKISVVRYAGRPPLDLVPLPRLLPRPLPRRQPPALRFSQQRAVNLSPPSTALTGGPLAKKKRPSGRSNWPKTKADRDAWMARRAARAARGEPVGRAALVAARRQAEAQAAARATLLRTRLASEDVFSYTLTSKQPPDRFFIRSKFAKASLFLAPRAIAAPQQRSRGLPVRARESEARAAGASHTLINELLRVGTRP